MIHRHTHTFTQQTQEDKKPVSVSDLVVKESKIVTDISFLRLGKRTGQGLFMPSNFTGLKLTEDIYLDDSILTAVTAFGNELVRSCGLLVWLSDMLVD